MSDTPPWQLAGAPREALGEQSLDYYAILQNDFTRPLR